MNGPVSRVARSLVMCCRRKPAFVIRPLSCCPPVMLTTAPVVHSHLSLCASPVGPHDRQGTLADYCLRAFLSLLPYSPSSFPAYKSPAWDRATLICSA